MSDRPTAFYDDLAIAPDADFERTLRRQLDRGLRGISTQPVPLSIEIDLGLELPAPSHPEPGRRDERGRSRRSIIAVAAAIAASIAIGVVVDELVADDSTELPTATVPPATSSPTTATSTPAADVPTTTEPLFSQDDIVAIKTLLWDSDYNLPGFTHVAGAPVTLDGLVADRLPACRAFVPTVFESDARPATIQSRLFQSSEDGQLMVQYVAVHPTLAQATAMLDEMQDPAFLGDCVPAYRATLPTDCCNDVQSWFPIYTGDQETTPPAIDVDADDIWIRSYRFDNWDDGEGRIHSSRQFAFAAIRVGRVVTTIDVMLSDNGVQLATTTDFERIVQHMAARAAAAQ